MTDCQATPDSSSRLTPLAREQLAALVDFYNDPTLRPGWGAQNYHEMLVHYYNLQISADASVLEIGCGDGRLLSRLNGRRRVGVDLSEQMIQKALKRFPEVEFHVQRGETLELEEKFDFIILSESRHDTEDGGLVLSSEVPDHDHIRGRKTPGRNGNRR